MWVQSIPVSRRALLAIARNSDSDPSVRGEENTKKQGVSQGGKSSARLGSNLGPDSAEYPLKPHYKTQNQAKRFNKLDNQNWFGTRGSEVQILSPRPYLVDSVDSILAVSASF
jgi:hypothetical protein